MATAISTTEVKSLVDGNCADPFALLGMHWVEVAGKRQIAVRAFVPDAARIEVRRRGGQGTYEAVRLHEAGFFEALIGDCSELFPYEFAVERGDGSVDLGRDPYSFWVQMSSYDQHLFNEGTHYQAQDVLGAQPRCIDGVDGVYFAVWAPNAFRVSVVGSFNHWDGRVNPMRSLGQSGIWELFVPGIGAGEAYKFELLAPGGSPDLKSDPFAKQSEIPPRSASIVCDLEKIQWTDSAWMERRASEELLHQPMSVYELHLGSWRRTLEGETLDYRDLAHQLVEHISDMGFTHIELMPIAEHPFDGSWGYQVVGYFAPTSRFGTPEDFAYFVDLCHNHGIGVIIDWVPGHFPRDGHGLARFDGTALFEHADPRQGAHPDWGTLIFNFERSEVCSFLLSNALFWLERYHIDGIRVDAVASMLYLDYSREDDEWVPNKYGGRENLAAIDFLKRFNTLTYERYPGTVTIAEESTSWPAVSRPTYAGGLGFGFKWNMGWMNDMLRYMAKDPVHRKFHQNDLTFSMLYHYHENFVLPLSHDEVVHGKGSLVAKMPGDDWQRLANLRLLYTFMYGHPGKKLLFMGAELAQWSEWDYRRSLDWHLLEVGPHAGVRDLLRDLNRIYRHYPALYASDDRPDGFEWIDCQDVENSVVAFRRQYQGESLVVVCNFTTVVRQDYRIGVPRAGFYAEVINSDADVYGGSGVGNGGGLEAQARPWHGQPYSLGLALPPLAALVFAAPPALQG
jgi:1,4-alpha-glucan branching enzyme